MPRSVDLRIEIGQVPRVCCVLMVLRCGMWLSPSSSSCVPRRRAGQAEPDRSQCGAWWVIPGGRRLFSVLHTGATRTPAEPPHGHPTHFTRPPTPKTTPPDTTTPQTHTRPRCPDTPQPQHKTEPISSRNRTDLDAEYDRSRAGTGPISTRSTTDLDAAAQSPQAVIRHRPAVLVEATGSMPSVGQSASALSQRRGASRPSHAAPRSARK